MAKEYFRTLSAVFPIILRREGGRTQILLHLRQNTGYMDGFWDVAGSGHVDGGETASQALCRECFEELGIRVRPQDTEFARLTYSVDSADETETYYHLFFFVRAYEGTPRIMEPDKSAALEWFDLDRLPDGMVPALRSDVGELMRGVVYGERIEPHCELNPADAVQEAADGDVLAASEKLLQRNAYVYEELAK